MKIWMLRPSFVLEICLSLKFVLPVCSFSRTRSEVRSRYWARNKAAEYVSLNIFLYPLRMFFYLIVRNCVFVQTVSIRFSRTKWESKSHSWARNIAHVNDLVFNHFCRGLGLGWGIHYLSWF